MRERRVGGHRFAQVSWASVLGRRLRALRAENGDLSLHEMRSFRNRQFCGHNQDDPTRRWRESTGLGVSPIT